MGNQNGRSCSGKLSWPVLRYYSNIYFEQVTNTKQRLSQFFIFARCHSLHDLYVRVQVFTIPQVAAGSGRGDNYTAMLYRVHIQGRTQDGEPWNRSLIYKCLPDNPTRRQAFKSDVLFRNEVAFYTQALPVLLEFQVSATCENW